MIPKIKFVYSQIYDRNWQIWEKAYKNSFPKNEDINISEFICEIRFKWEKIEKEILEDISKTLNLDWKEKDIKCYVINKGVPFSDPLTIPIVKNKDRFIDILIHELIHIILTQNEELTKLSLKYFEKKELQNFNKITKIHIIVHALLNHIYVNKFSEENILRDIEISKRNQDYKVAWEFVEKQGYKNIIKEFVSYYN